MVERMSFAQVRQNLLETMKPTTLMEIVRFVEQKKPVLWGEQKPRAFLKQQVYFVLLKLKTGMGFQKLKTHFAFPHQISICSLEHNFATLLPLFELWGREKITLGSIQE